MDNNQIIRIPLKYWELFNAMSNEESWKLIKSLFKWKDDWLDWLTLTYYNIIMVDITNLHNSVVNGKKGGRPKKETGIKENKKGGFEKKKGGLSKTITNTSKDKVKESKINNISKDITTKVESFWNEEINRMQEFIKSEVVNIWYIYKSWKQERNRIKNILTAKTINELAIKFNMWIYEFIKNIILLSSKIEFRNWKITNAESLYKYYDKILNESIKLKNGLLDTKIIREIW